jgi:adenosylhomocysteine nucleosidase
VIPLGIVTGLASEAECLDAISADPGVRVLCAGPGPSRAADCARRLLSEGCSALISFGIAGGLDPALDAGALIVARSVVTADGRRLTVAEAWRQRLIDGLGGDPVAIDADIAGADNPAVTSEDRNALRKTTGAAAVDMESHAVAQVASAQGVPFLLVRAIADPGERNLPPWIPSTVGSDGRPRLRAVAAGLLGHPWDLPVLVRLAVDSRRALATLRRVALRAGPLFFLDG